MGAAKLDRRSRVGACTRARGWSSRTHSLAHALTRAPAHALTRPRAHARTRY